MSKSHGSGRIFCIISACLVFWSSLAALMMIKSADAALLFIASFWASVALMAWTQVPQQLQVRRLSFLLVLQQVTFWASMAAKLLGSQAVHRVLIGVSLLSIVALSVYIRLQVRQQPRQAGQD
ncbi:MAG TPA: hypothetical protein VNK82_06620 [Terriglobales bacterium]|nr:hypothetical protein [Terriglobales bacterium]